MAFPLHYKQSRPSSSSWEPVIPSYFRMILMPPAAVGADTDLLIEHIISVGGLDNINPAVDAVTQKSRWIDRSYASQPNQTYFDLALTFSLNLNDIHENYVYTTIRKWANMSFNPKTGRFGLKRDYRGGAVLDQFDRDGSIWRRIEFSDMFPTGQITGMGDVNIDTKDPAQLSVTFRADNYLEHAIGIADEEP